MYPTITDFLGFIITVGVIFTLLVIYVNLKERAESKKAKEKELEERINKLEKQSKESNKKINNKTTKKQSMKKDD